jgi:hypothetical protein
MSREQVLAALIAVAGLAVGGCSSGESESADAGLCSSADDLRSSISDLGDVQVVEDGTEEVRQTVSEVGDDVARLADEARDEFSDQVSAVEAAVGDLGSALDSLGSAPSAAALGEVRTAVRTLVEDAGVLLDDVSSSC